MDSVAIDLADLRLVFRSTDPVLLEIVRTAAGYCPQHPEPRDLPPRVSAQLLRREQVGWEPGTETTRAFSPHDGDAFSAVLRAALCDALAPHGALLHAAGAVVRGKAVLFIAPSGGGKSTLSNLIGESFPLLSDETICLRPSREGSGEYLAYGTCFWSSLSPRSGPHSGFPIAALCFLEKGPLRCVPLGKRQALRGLLAEYHLREAPSAAFESLNFAHQILARVPAHRLRFPLGADLASLLDSLVSQEPSEEAIGAF
jgi:hypothetical protein